ncbi:MAG: hypothetical protein ACI959_000236 [Limisphaerales bacterium]
MKAILSLVLSFVSICLYAQPCISIAPTNLQATYTLGAGATLNWDAVPSSVACQVTGEEVGTGIPKSIVISEFEASGTFIPDGFLTPGSEYSWSVRAACSISPLDVSTYAPNDTFLVFSSNTIGLTINDNASVWEGYNLHYPHNQQSAYLLDNCGRVVHNWPDTVYTPGNSIQILEDGKLLRLGSLGRFANPVFTAGGSANVLQLKSWANNIIWEYEMSDTSQRAHHDFALLPNGNILQITYTYRSGAEAIQAGRDPSMLPNGEVHPDRIIEIEPILPNSANIVWEWNSWDHTIQDFDASKDNFGVIADHPELININYGDMVKDWLHNNSVDYVEEFDLIILSIPTFNEFWIIDHSTTTAQAASSAGGDRGKGGDLLYRWGNPEAYGRGLAADAQLSFQHDVQRIDDFLDPSVMDYGKIMLFNNKIGGSFSRVDIIDIPWNASGDFPTLASGVAWGPASAEWSYTRPVPEDMFSTGLSGAQRLPNGNTLIDVGRSGFAFEITPSENIVWNYQNPIINGVVQEQGSTDIPTNLLFRFNRYPIDYIGFIGRNLTPGNPIELNPSALVCPLEMPLRLETEIIVESQIKLYPNPAYSLVYAHAPQATLVQLFDLTGKMLQTALVNNDLAEFSVANLANGAYLVVADNGSKELLAVFK